jgi:hypothetical protein
VNLWATSDYSFRTRSFRRLRLKNYSKIAPYGYILVSQQLTEAA